MDAYLLFYASHSYGLKSKQKIQNSCPRSALWNLPQKYGPLMHIKPCEASSVAILKKEIFFLPPWRISHPYYFLWSRKSPVKDNFLQEYEIFRIVYAASGLLVASLAINHIFLTGLNWKFEKMNRRIERSSWWSCWTAQFKPRHAIGKTHERQRYTTNDGKTVSSSSMMKLLNGTIILPDSKSLILVSTYQIHELSIKYFY